MTHAGVAFEKPENADLLLYLRGPRLAPATGSAAGCSPEAVRDPYLRLGTHPELVARLWDEITTALPVRCAWVVFGTPALVRPDTGIVFAFARGTHTYALRLPPTQRAAVAAAARRQAEASEDQFALSSRDREQYVQVQASDVHTYSDGSTFDVSTLGRDWVLGRWLPDEPAWCLAAYEHAG